MKVCPIGFFFLLLQEICSIKNAAYLLRRAAQATIQNTNTTKRDLFMFFDYTIPCAIMALATFMKPAMFAPFT